MHLVLTYWSNWYKTKSLTNPKESEKNFLNKSQNPKLSNQESLEKEEEEEEEEKKKMMMI